MTDYKVNGDGVIFKGSQYIPADPRNRHYRDYLQWVAAGNSPDPEFTPEEALERAVAQDKSDAMLQLQKQNAYLFEMVLFLWQAIKSKTNLTNADVPPALLEKAQSWQQYIDKLK